MVPRCFPRLTVDEMRRNQNADLVKISLAKIFALAVEGGAHLPSRVYLVLSPVMGRQVFKYTLVMSSCIFPKQICGKQNLESKILSAPSYAPVLQVKGFYSFTFRKLVGLFFFTV